MSIEWLSIINIITSLTCSVLAIFAIWLAVGQRKESHQNYKETRELLAKIDTRSATTEEKVSENFQKMLSSVLPKKTAEEGMLEIISSLMAQGKTDELEKLMKSFAEIRGRAEIRGHNT